MKCLMKPTENAGTSNLFFFDTYAFIEVIRGNPAYKRFENVPIITTILNIAELNYILKKEMSKEKADGYADQYSIYIVDITVEDIKNATDLKIKNRNFSLPDAIGYIIAEKHDARFLTGDEDFKNMSNVEFVKK